MKNTINRFRITAFIVMVIVFSTAAYAQRSQGRQAQEAKQRSITVTGVPANYKGKTGMLYLAPSANSTTYTAYSLVIVNGASVSFPLSDLTTDKPWTDNGDFAFILMIGENAQAITKKQYLYSGQITDTTSIKQEVTTVQWTSFVSAADAKQRSITVTGVPANYKGKTGMLYLSQSANSTNYTAYSMVIVNGASVSFPLSDLATDKPWTNSGDFAFVLMIGENAQAITKKQYLYSGQTPDTTSIKQEVTTVQWSIFVSAADAKQRSITITGVPANYKGKTGMLYLSPSANNTNYTAYSMVIVNGTSVSFPLSDLTTDKPWTGNGNFAFVLMIGENAQAITKKQYLYSGQVTDVTNIKQEVTTVQWTSFVSAVKEVKQKSVTLSGIPNSYKGKVGMLVIAPANDNQNYTAYGMVTITTPSTAFPMLDWTTDDSWGGSGNFIFILMIGENMQAMSADQYTYTSQSNDVTNINQDSTAIKWSQFVEVKPQQFKKPSRPKKR